MPWKPLPFSLATTVLVLLAALLAGAAPAEARSSCQQPLALLVDRSASMAEHDPFGALRLAVAEAMQRDQPARAGDVVWPFDAALGTAVDAGEGWPAAVAAALAGGDRGATSLAAVLAELPDAAASVVLLTDGEASLPEDGRMAGRLAAVVVLGGAPNAGLRAGAVRAGARLFTVRSPREAHAVGGAGCPEASPPPAAGAGRRDVVLISGLGSTTGQVRSATTPAQCGAAGALADWCAALTRAGDRLWVPSAAPRRQRGAVLDSTGPLAGNAAALTAWWARAAGGPEPVLVGHSMGGLIAHAATRRGLRARALVTVGTPHAGSYGADAYFAALAVARSCSLSCPVATTQLLGAAVGLRRRFGRALGDLTREQRTRIAPLGQPSIPLATYAGAPNALPGLPGGVALGAAGRGAYASPNDGIVGVGSATGALAGLQPATSVRDGDARHSMSVPPAGAPTQLRSPAVERWLVATSQAVAVTAARRAGARSPRASLQRRGSSPRRAGVSLRPVATVQGAAGLERPVDPGAVVVATAPIGVWCDGESVPLVRVDAGLWFVDLGLLGCHAAAASPVAGGVGWALGTTDAAGPGRAEELLATRRRDGRWLVQLRLATPGRIELWRGRRRIGLRAASAGPEWRDRQAWHGVIGRRGARELTVRVTTPGMPPRVASLHLP